MFLMLMTSFTMYERGWWNEGYCKIDTIHGVKLILVITRFSPIFTCHILLGTCKKCDYFSSPSKLLAKVVILGKMTTLVVSFILFSPAWANVYSGTGVTKNDLSKPVVLLGGLFPVHKNEDNVCGGILELGVQRLEAMVFATELINQSPQLLPEVTLAFEIRDTCVRANLALEQSLNYVSSRNLRNEDFNSTVIGISGVVGAASSGVSIAVANLLRLFQVPQISYASTAKILSDKTRFDYFLRTVPPDSLQAKAMAEIIEMFNWTYIHVIYSDDAYGSEGIKAFIEELSYQNMSVCIASNIIIPLGVTKESVFDEAVQELDEEWVRNSSVVVIFGQLSTATGILNAVERRDAIFPGFAARFVTIGSDAWGDQLPNDLKPVALGMLSVSPKALLSDPFDRYFTSLNPINYTANPWFNEYWEFLFNCSFNGENGLKPCDPANEVISQENGYRQNGKVTFTIDAVYAFAHAIDKIIDTQCPDDTLCQEITDQRSGGVSIKGDILLKYLHNISFPGASVDVLQFDSSGDEVGLFIIKNLKKRSTGEYFYDSIASWSEDTSLVFHGDIEWSNSTDIPISVCSLPCGGGEFPEPVSGQSDCCWICQPCPGDNLVSTGLVCSECIVGYIPNKEKIKCVLISPDFLKWSSPWAIVILMATILGIIATGIVISVFIVFHKHALVKASSRELSAVLLSGLLCCYLIPFFFIAKPSIPICCIRRLSVGLIFSICYSALLVKTNRIHRIFNRSKTSLQKPPLISPQSQVFFTFLLVSVQVVIAVVWLIVERPSIVVIYDDFDAELKCGESTHIGLAVSLGYSFILLLLSTYYAFRSRKIPQNFNEAKFINLTLYTTCVIWLAFITTYIATAKLGTVYQTSSLVLAIDLSAATTLCCLFMPKIYFLISEKRKEYRKSEHFTNSKSNRIRNNSVCSTHALTDHAINLNVVDGQGLSSSNSFISKYVAAY